MTTHGFRKYFATVIKGNGMDKTYSEMVMGHNMGLDKVYFKATWQEVLEGNDRIRGYISIINDLTINEENRLRRQVQQLTIRTDKLEEIQNRMDRLDRMLGLE